MKIERNADNAIIIRDTNDEEIHPYLTTLAAIEFQSNIIPPRIPELSTVGWNVVITALRECIDNLGSPFKITDLEVKIEKDGTVSEVVTVEDREDAVIPKAPDVEDVIALEQNPPDTVILANNTTIRKNAAKR